MIYFLLFFISLAGLLMIFVKRYRSIFRNKSFLKVVPDEMNSAPSTVGAVSSATASSADEQVDFFSQDLSHAETLEMREIFRRAESFFSTGVLENMDEAERLYVKVLSFDENHVDAQSRLGLIYLRKGLTLKAEAVYMKLLLLVPENPSYYSNLALSLYMQKRYEEARDMYLKSIELDPNRPQRYINLAQVYRDLFLFNEAIISVQKAIQLAPESAEYHLVMAEIYTDTKQLEPAKDILQRFLKQQHRTNPLRPMARVLLKKIKKLEITASA